MILRHVHDWKIVAKTFAPGVQGLNRLRGMSVEDMQRLVCGTTTILWECQVPTCRRLRREEMSGSIAS